MVRAKLLTVMSAVALLGCGAPDNESAMEPGPRVAVSPTAAGQMPAAIIGEGGDLEGSDVA